MPHAILNVPNVQPQAPHVRPVMMGGSITPLQKSVEPPAPTLISRRDQLITNVRVVTPSVLNVMVLLRIARPVILVGIMMLLLILV